MPNFTKNRTLTSIHGLVGITAMGGGLWLMSNPSMMPLDWLEGTFFENFFLPGLILFGVVGSSAVIAALSMLMNLSSRYSASLIASVILIFWLIAEIVIIGEVHFLQILYFALGFTSLYLLFKASKRDTK